MAKRISGSLNVWVTFTGQTDDLGRGEYKGFVHAPGKGNWHFDGVYVDSPTGPGTKEAYDRAAVAAIEYGGFYCTGNRDDVPEWAPSEEVANAIHDNHDYVPDSIGMKIPKMENVYLGELVVVFRSAEAQTLFWRIMEKLAGAQRRGHLRVIDGGLHAA